MQAQELPSGSRRWCSPLQCHLFDLLLHVFRIAPLQHCQTQDGAVDIVFIQSIPFSLKKNAVSITHNATSVRASGVSC